MTQNSENSLNNRHLKRRVATIEGVQMDLKNELPLMFQAFWEAFDLYSKEIVITPPDARARGFEASLLNSKMIQCIQKHFPRSWIFGKYKRFTLRTNGYVILFKKLDKHNRPLNVKTKAVEAISYQLSLPLYEEAGYSHEPILFFGYKKDRMGNLTEPSLVYIDEDKVKWVVTSADISVVKAIKLTAKTRPIASPVLKKRVEGKNKIG